ncbi:hypothetical protein VTK73DRAFT_9772 [Phialemonium thermophilum]|uniref:Signal peptidase complex subunit 1 n=1 Tax=Phialemonium thermophilum TaxID=223376 RepID=A0ABR3XK69_9PEZI
MAEQVLDRIRDVAEGQIDFEGQKLAELMVNIGLSGVGVLAFIVGYMLQDIKLSLYILLGGTAVVFAVVVPPWPYFNRNPVKWLPVTGGTFPAVPQNLVIDEKAVR